MDQYSPDKTRPSGFKPECKSCHADRTRAYYAANAEKRRAYRRAYVAQHPDRVRAIDRRSRQKNADKVAAARKVAYQKNRQYYAEKNARWVRENPVENRLRRARYRARKAGAEGSFSKAEFLDLCEKYGNVCLCCRSSDPLEPDHVVPLSKGGTNWIDNIQPLCRSCNARKKDREVDYRPLSVSEPVAASDADLTLW